MRLTTDYTSCMSQSFRLGQRNIIAFVTIANGERAKQFYRDTLGLRLVSDEAFALVFDANGVMLRLAKANQVMPAPGTVLGWNVPDIATAVTELKDAGVFFERFEGMAQDELGIWYPPSGAKVAWFKDPDGNLLSLTEFADDKD
jgi:catechol 2,3-dioxygenase-like lactoylglutathione lyase family enzyme